MGRVKFLIPEDELRRLYINERWSPSKIAKKFGCISLTVRARLIEAQIPLKTKSAAQTKEVITHKLKPYLRHKKRISDANMVLQNIATRRLHGTIS